VIANECTAGECATKFRNAAGNGDQVARDGAKCPQIVAGSRQLHAQGVGERPLRLIKHPG
jgi:hypothetical protein